ncbi:hypothetical protein Leryth_013780 [Lithospermum erythrorhizon]|nr:hypothetical protein Leryth_013780 [Lithospermum erythrorhizon]
MHYCSSHKILLVGEGDFSFSVCLAKAFGSAQNMVATSLDSEAEVKRKYSGAEANLNELKERGCTIVHQVDVQTMSSNSFNHITSVQLFDRIVFNFPHAGFYMWEHEPLQIILHQELVRGFFRNAKNMLREGGEVHVTHKTAYPFSNWRIADLASEAGLYLKGEAAFYNWLYPSYENKRGEGARCNESFPVGNCSTFQFAKLF